MRLKQHILILKSQNRLIVNDSKYDRFQNNITVTENQRLNMFDRVYVIFLVRFWLQKALVSFRKKIMIWAKISS